MLRCRDFVGQFASDAGDADWRRRWGWRVHLSTCAGCRRFAEQIQWIGRTARALTVAPLSPDDEAMVREVREHVLTVIRQRQGSA